MVTDPITPPAPGAVLDLLDRHTDALVADVGRLGASDLGGASLCDGWSRGHVLSHLARNAEAIGRLTYWATTGKHRPMYPGGPRAREDDIEAGARRGPQQQLDDLRETAATLRSALLDLAARGPAVEQVEGRGGAAIASAALPMMRLREVVFHHVDLDRGFGFSDIDNRLLAAFLDDAVRRHGAAGLSLDLRSEDGRSWTLGEGAQRVTGTTAGLLLWLTRRNPSAVHSADPLPDIPKGN